MDDRSSRRPCPIGLTAAFSQQFSSAMVFFHDNSTINMALFFTIQVSHSFFWQLSLGPAFSRQFSLSTDFFWTIQLDISFFKDNLNSALPQYFFQQFCESSVIFSGQLLLGQSIFWTIQLRDKFVLHTPYKLHFLVNLARQHIFCTRIQPGHSFCWIIKICYSFIWTI